MHPRDAEPRPFSSFWQRLQSRGILMTTFHTYGAIKSNPSMTTTKINTRFYAAKAKLDHRFRNHGRAATERWWLAPLSHEEAMWRETTLPPAAHHHTHSLSVCSAIIALCNTGSVVQHHHHHQKTRNTTPERERVRQGRGEAPLQATTMFRRTWHPILISSGNDLNVCQDVHDPACMDGFSVLLAPLLRRSRDDTPICLYFFFILLFLLPCRTSNMPSYSSPVLMVKRNEIVSMTQVEFPFWVVDAMIFSCNNIMQFWGLVNWRGCIVFRLFWVNCTREFLAANSFSLLFYSCSFYMVSKQATLLVIPCSSINMVKYASIQTWLKGYFVPWIRNIVKLSRSWFSILRNGGHLLRAHWMVYF